LQTVRSANDADDKSDHLVSAVHIKIYRSGDVGFTSDYYSIPDINPTGFVIKALGGELTAILFLATAGIAV